VIPAEFPATFWVPRKTATNAVANWNIHRLTKIFPLEFVLISVKSFVSFKFHCHGDFSGVIDTAKAISAGQ
jgi:hypothetical protein